MSSDSPVPPTSNTLHNLERTRLMKSTRKLTELLGTTPHVLEHEVSLPPAAHLLPIGSKPSFQAHRTRPSVSSDIKSQRRSTKFYINHSPSSSISSLETISANHSTISLSLNTAGSTPALLRMDVDQRSTKTMRSRKAMPRPLFLRLQSLPRLSKSTENSFTSKSPFALASPPLAQEPDTPTSPSSSPTPATGANSRRRKMAKLIRTLGENVPPELVFPVHPTKKLEQMCLVRDDSDETDSDKCDELDDEDSDMPFAGYGWTEDITYTTSPRARRASISNNNLPTPLTERKSRHARSQSHFSPPQTQDTFVYSANTVNVAPHPGQVTTRRSGIEDFGWEMYTSPSQATDGHGHGCGRWQGEWNRGDMKQVRRGLRALKSR